MSQASQTKDDVTPPSTPRPLVRVPHVLRDGALLRAKQARIEAFIDALHAEEGESEGSDDEELVRILQQREQPPPSPVPMVMRPETPAPIPATQVVE